MDVKLRSPEDFVAGWVKMLKAENESDLKQRADEVLLSVGQQTPHQAPKQESCIPLIPLQDQHGATQNGAAEPGNVPPAIKNEPQLPQLGPATGKDTLTLTLPSSCHANYL